MPVSNETLETHEPARRTVGALLRETRRSVGGDIDRIAINLRIRPEYIRAIEESRYDQLPAPVYALGFVRAYANYLGLDGDEAVRRFKHETVGFEPPKGLSFPVPLAERSIPGGTMVLAAVILALCGYGLWYYVSTGERARPERVSAVPANLAPPPITAPSRSPVTPPAARPAPAASTGATPAPAPASAAKAAPAATGSNTPGSAVSGSPPAPAAATTPAATAPATSASAAASRITARPVAQPDAAAPASAAANASVGAPASTPTADDTRVYGAAGQPSRIVIKFSQDCWIQIRDGDRILIDKVLHPGESYRVGNRSGLIMDVGNAVGLVIDVDGHKTPAITGTVRHDIVLDPARLIAGTAAPK